MTKNKLEKVIVLSYFAPPCNLTAAQRIKSWQNHLYKFGYYPITVTRNWTGDELNEYSRLMNSGSSERVEKNDNGTTYYLPYKQSLRDTIFIKSQSSAFFSYLSKLATFINLIFQNYSLSYISYNNLYYKTKELLGVSNDIKYVVISANPFEQFYFGYLLKKEFPDVKIIADYRDDWTTSELNPNKSFLQRIIHVINVRSEKKWLRSYDLITSVSGEYANRLTNFTGIKSSVLLNGYDFEGIKLDHVENNHDTFTIVYNGSLYDSQPIEVFLNAYKKIIDTYKSKIALRLLFPGLKDNSVQSHRVLSNMVSYESFIEVYSRMPRQNVVDMQLASDVLLMISHQNIKGIPSSKLYEYIGLKKPILLFPNDHDIVFQTLTDTKVGYICDDENQIFEQLKNLIEEKIKNKKIEISPVNIEFYSREVQTKELANCLDKL